MGVVKHIKMKNESNFFCPRLFAFPDGKCIRIVELLSLYLSCHFCFPKGFYTKCSYYARGFPSQDSQLTGGLLVQVPLSLKESLIHSKSPVAQPNQTFFSFQQNRNCSILWMVSCDRKIPIRYLL